MSESEEENVNYSFGYRFLLKGEGKISTEEFHSLLDLVGDEIVELGGRLETMGCNPEAFGERNVSVFLDCGVTDKEKATELKKSLVEWTSVQEFCEQVVSEDELKFINEE